MTEASPPEAAPNSSESAPVTPPRERLIRAATRLFRQHGINATGVDAIVGEAGTAKTTLYKLFGSKTDLVEAVLRSESRIWREWFFAAIETASSPRAKLDAIFPVLKRWFGENDYSGCVFINAVGEHDKDEVRLRAITLRHKSLVLAHIAALAGEAGARRPEAVAHQIGLLMDGAIVTAMVTREPDVADAAGAAAAALLDQACRSSRVRRPRRSRLQGGAAALAKEDLGVID
jgi:AcrR family transcriptional regulator